MQASDAERACALSDYYNTISMLNRKKTKSSKIRKSTQVWSLASAKLEKKASTLADLQYIYSYIYFANSL